MKSKVKTETKVTVEIGDDKAKLSDLVTPKGQGKLDMVIAFDTTGSMAAYIEDVRNQVADMIPRLFADNEDLRLSIVAFGDYCDMANRNVFGDAYQCLPLTNNENEIIRFVRESHNTSGGDGDEFYELVLKKIIEEQPWREDSSKAILLIADAYPHEIGYTYKDYVVGNQIDWREEARRAAAMNIKIDTVSICGASWYKELSDMTNGICVPFTSSGNTSTMIETATIARSAMAFAESPMAHTDLNKAKICMLRKRMSDMEKLNSADAEFKAYYSSYKDRLDEVDPEE